MFTNQEALPKNLIIAINSNITRCYKNSKGRHYHYRTFWHFSISAHNHVCTRYIWQTTVCNQPQQQTKGNSMPDTVADDRSTPTLSNLLYPVINQEVLGHRRRDHGAMFLRPIRRSVYTQENEHMSRK